jgi:hypothetical protein
MAPPEPTVTAARKGSFTEHVNHAATLTMSAHRCCCTRRCESPR